jgi:hypothetical protein
MFVGPGLEPVSPIRAIIPRSLPHQGMVSKKGEVVSSRNASNGHIEPFRSSIHAFSSRRIHITLADFMDQAPQAGHKNTPYVV